MVTCFTGLGGRVGCQCRAGGFGVFESLMDMRSPRATTSLKPFEFRRAGLATSKPGWPSAAARGWTRSIYGLHVPKGVLVTEVPGTGKSTTAKAWPPAAR